MKTISYIILTCLSITTINSDLRSFSLNSILNETREKLVGLFGSNIKAEIFQKDIPRTTQKTLVIENNLGSIKIKTDWNQNIVSLKALKKASADNLAKISIDIDDKNADTIRLKTVFKDAREKLIMLLAALCHDLGKATTTEFIGKKWRSLGHDKEGAGIAKKFLPRITIKKELIPIVRTLVEYHMYVLFFITDNAGPAAYKRLAKKIAPDVTLEMLMMLARADHRARNPQKGWPLEVDDEKDIKLFIERAHNAFVLQQAEPPVLQGRDFLDVVAPGPLLGTLVDRAYAIQIDQDIRDKDRLKSMVFEEYRLGHIGS